MKITAVLIVDRIEPSLEFWLKRLSFEKTVEVPEGDHLGFVILRHGDGEVMLQTRTSAAADIPAMGVAGENSGAGLFIEVQDFDNILTRTADMTPLLPVRTTFYGMKEIGFREPGGHIVVFAAPAAQAETSAKP